MTSLRGEAAVVASCACKRDQNQSKNRRKTATEQPQTSRKSHRCPAVHAVAELKRRLRLVEDGRPGDTACAEWVGRDAVQHDRQERWHPIGLQQNAISQCDYRNFSDPPPNNQAMERLGCVLFIYIKIYNIHLHCNVIHLFMLRYIISIYINVIHSH